jgi:hypothetical protein
LEEQFEQLRENPLHIEAVPGRKTDAKDCEWIADLLQHGLLKEVIYRRPYPGLHDLARYPVEQRQSQCRVADRTQDLLEQANLNRGNAEPDAPHGLGCRGHGPGGLSNTAGGNGSVQRPKCSSCRSTARSAR